VRTEILCRVALLVALAERDEQPAVTREHEARTKMVPAGDLRLLAEDHLDVGEPQAVELRARDRRAIGVTVAGLRIGEVDRRVRSEIRIGHDVQQPALSLCMNPGHAANRLGERSLRVNVAQAAGTLGHEHAPVRQECEAPRVLETARDRRDRDRRFAARLPVRRVLAGAGAREQRQQQQAATGHGAWLHVDTMTLPSLTFTG
jgi:hypothetical protein